MASSLEKPLTARAAAVLRLAETAGTSPSIGPSAAVPATSVFFRATLGLPLVAARRDEAGAVEGLVLEGVDECRAPLGGGHEHGDVSALGRAVLAGLLAPRAARSTMMTIGPATSSTSLLRILRPSNTAVLAEGNQGRHGFDAGIPDRPDVTVLEAPPGACPPLGSNGPGRLGRGPSDGPRVSAAAPRSARSSTEVRWFP